MKFSIVTISFNQAEFLERAICSVLEQEYPEIEYIVVDAGSTDGSRDIIERYRSRLSAAIFQKDQGPADGLNKGFSGATGDVCGYINADDFFEPNAFSEVASYFVHNPDVDVVCGAIKIVDRSGRAQWRKRMSDKFDLSKFADGRCWIGQQATFFRRTAYLKSNFFNVGNRTCWDTELLVHIALSGSKFGTVYKVLGNFRMHASSISGSGRLMDEYIQDRNRIRSIIHEYVAPLQPSVFRSISKFLYRFDIRRQIRNYLVR